MPKIIAVTNQKGGVGKTTTTISLAFQLAQSKRRVLLVDLDPQANATSGLGIEKANLKLSIQDALYDSTQASSAIMATKFKNLWLLPSRPDLATAEVDLAPHKDRVLRLKKLLQNLENYDYILIDCPPSLGLLTVNALVATEYILLPVQAEYYALEGLSQLLETVQLVKKALNPDLQVLGVLLTMFSSRTTLSGQVRDEVIKHFKERVFEAVIPRNVRVAEAPSHGLPVGLYDRWSKGARAYKQLTKEVISRVEQ
jgi:chromosome partitioning protein